MGVRSIDSIDVSDHDSFNYLFKIIGCHVKQFLRAYGGVWDPFFRWFKTMIDKVRFNSIGLDFKM